MSSGRAAPKEVMTFKKQEHRHKAAIVAAAGDGGYQISVCTCGKWRRWVRRPHRFGAEGKWRDVPAPFCGRPRQGDDDE